MVTGIISSFLILPSKILDAGCLHSQVKPASYLNDLSRVGKINSVNAHSSTFCIAKRHLWPGVIDLIPGWAMLLVAENKVAGWDWSLEAPWQSIAHATKRNFVLSCGGSDDS